MSVAWRESACSFSFSSFRTSSLERKSSMFDTVSPATVSDDERCTSSFLSSNSWDSSAANSSAARSSLMSSFRFSLPSYMVFCTARPRNNRCSSTKQLTTSSDGLLSTVGVGGRSAFDTRVLQAGSSTLPGDSADPASSFCSERMELIFCRSIVSFMAFRSCVERAFFSIMPRGFRTLECDSRTGKVSSRSLMLSIDSRGMILPVTSNLSGFLSGCCPVRVLGA
mmetsp:Transcript_22724/g.47174  ORF Transcript_22724/g.47174 Transcript_22724/m.47174 type:complete len:224 (-) Transcript_22724:25-696(-)